MRELAHNTNEYCGDGTTTATILAHSIYSKGLKIIEAGYNPVEVKRGMEIAKDEIIQFLDMVKVEVDNDWDKSRHLIKNAAMVSGIFWDFSS